MQETPDWFDATAPSLQYEVKNGIQAVKEYLDKHPESLNNINHVGCSALHYASMFGNLEIVKYLLEKGADIHLNSEAGIDALHHASKFGNLEIVKYLISKGAEINKADNTGNYPIHAVSFFNHLNIMKYLCEKGAEIDCVNKKGETPLCFTCHDQRLNLTQFLIKKGADPNIKINLGYDVFSLFILAKAYNGFNYLVGEGSNDDEFLNYLTDELKPNTLINNCLSIPFKKFEKQFFQLITDLVKKGSAIEVDPFDKIILYCKDDFNINKRKDRYKIFHDFFNVVVKNYLKNKTVNDQLEYKKILFLKLPKSKSANSIKMVMVNDGFLDKPLTKNFKEQVKKSLNDVLNEINSQKNFTNYEEGFLNKVLESNIYKPEELKKYEKIYNFLNVGKSVNYEVKIVGNMTSVEDFRINEYDEKIRELKQKNLSILERETKLTDLIDKEKRALRKNPDLNSSINENVNNLESLKQKSKSIKTLLANIEERSQTIKDEIAKSSNADIVAKDGGSFKIDKASFDSYLNNFSVTKSNDSSVVFNSTSKISEEEKQKISGVLSRFYESEREKTGFDEKKFFSNPAFTNKFRDFIQKQYKTQIKTSQEGEFNSKFQELSALIDSTNDIIKHIDKPKAIDMTSEKVQTRQSPADGGLTRQSTIEEKPGGVERRDQIRDSRKSATPKTENNTSIYPSPPIDKTPKEPTTTPASSVKINYNSSEIANLKQLFGIETFDEQLKLHSKGITLSKYEDFLVNLSQQNLEPSKNLQDKKEGELKQIFHQKLDNELIANILPKGSNPADQKKLRSYLYGIIAYQIGGRKGEEQFIQNYLKLQKTSFERGEFTGFAHASGADKATLLKMIALVDKLIEVKTSYQEEVRQLQTSKTEELEQKTLPPHPLRIDNFHRQLLIKIPELNRPEKGDKEYLNDLLAYYRDYDKTGSYRSSSENSIKRKFDDLKQEFKDLTSLALDFAVNRNDESAIMAQNFSHIFGLTNEKDFKNLQEKFTKGGDKLFDDKKIKDYFLNFLKEENFIELSPPQGAKTKSKFIKFKEFSQEKFKELEDEYRQREEVKSGAKGVGRL